MIDFIRSNQGYFEDFITAILEESFTPEEGYESRQLFHLDGTPDDE